MRRKAGRGSPGSGLAPGVIDEDTAHGLGGRGEEVSPVVEVLIAHQSQIGLVNQGGSLQRVTNILTPHFTGGDAMEFAVNQRSGFVAGFRIAIPHSIEKECNVGWLALSRRLRVFSHLDSIRQSQIQGNIFSCAFREARCDCG